MKTLIKKDIAYVKKINGLKIGDIRDRKYNALYMGCDMDYFDYETKVDRLGAVYAQILYIPNKDRFEHEHISLTDTEVRRLKEWCQYYLRTSKGLKKVK
jgi:hypothetical protein